MMVSLPSPRCVTLRYSIWISVVPSLALTRSVKCARLKVLNINYTKVSDNGIAAVSQLSGIEEIGVAGCTTTSPTSFLPLSYYCRSLKKINFGATSIDDYGLDMICCLPYLEDVALFDCGEALVVLFSIALQVHGTQVPILPGTLGLTTPHWQLLHLFLGWKRLTSAATPILPALRRYPSVSSSRG